MIPKNDYSAIVPGSDSQKDKIVDERILKGTRHLGFVKVVKGHQMFCLNLKDMSIAPVKFNESAIMRSLGGVKMESVLKKSLKVENHCLYCQALNRKNAVKKFMKMLKRNKVQ
jgi:CDP-glycerol glycerophosphotransferase (TagB/SpsB family)